MPTLHDESLDEIVLYPGTVVELAGRTGSNGIVLRTSSHMVRTEGAHQEIIVTIRLKHQGGGKRARWAAWVQRLRAVSL